MNPVAITLLFAAALAGFGALAWRKLAIVVALCVQLAPENIRSSAGATR